MKTKRDIPTHESHRAAYLIAWKLRKTKRLTGSEIARRLGLAKETVCSWLRTGQRFGAVRVQAHNTIEYKKFLRLWQNDNKTLSSYAMARKVGLPEGLVRQWIKKEKEHAERSK